MPRRRTRTRLRSADIFIRLAGQPVACYHNRMRSLLFLVPVLAHAATLQVSSDGPLKSLEGARDAIRTMRHGGSQEPVTVVVHGGFYRLGTTFVLTAEDSGVTYEAAPGERPILSGGRAITGWKKGSGPIWTAPA